MSEYYLGIFLKHRFAYCRSGVEPEIAHFDQAHRDISAARNHILSVSIPEYFFILSPEFSHIVAASCKGD